MSTLSFWDFQPVEPYQKAEVCQDQLTALYFIVLCDLVFIIVLWSKKLLLHLALFSITDMHMWHWYIAICMLLLHTNNKIKCYINLFLCPFAIRRNEWVAGLRCSVCQTHPWHKKLQSCEANCPLSSNKWSRKLF